ncbi:Na+/melibiose symporter [Thermoactinomyces sp. DSM 45891]|uniref:MDR family MFS transporter n=1 Tax=Thermoactinomyces sp. DSM 45891 TaxID=1761907 RepID=UPI0009244383|nr:MFS transporter [Thermoactinomyces sp. DSM 45891]SFX20516.1 Na+/melibiose symporter [Thermoactinomyces sp. DSM 45891]
MKNLKDIHPIGWTIIIGTMFGRFSTSMSIPFLAIYLTNVLHATPIEAGLVIASSSGIGILASFYGGFLADKIGHKTVMLTSVFGGAFVFLGFAFSQSVLAFFLVNALNGLCKSIFEPSSRALLSDITEEKKRLLIYNLRYAAINIGVVFGPLIGVVLGSSRSTTPFLFAVAVYALYGLVLVYQSRAYPTLFYKNDLSERISLRRAFHVTRTDTVFLFTIMGVLFCAFGYGSLNATFPQYFATLPGFGDGVKISYLMSLNAISVLVFQYPVVRIAQKFSPYTVLIVGSLCICASNLSIAFISHFFALGIVIILFTIGEILIFTLTDALVDSIAKPELKGTYFGAMGFSQLGNVLSPIVGGWLLSYFGAGQPLIIFGVLVLVTLLGVPLLLRAKYKLASSKKHTIPKVAS